MSSPVLKIFSDLLELVELGPQPLDLVLHRRSTGLPDLNRMRVKEYKQNRLIQRCTSVQVKI